MIYANIYNHNQEDKEISKDELKWEVIEKNIADKVKECKDLKQENADLHNLCLALICCNYIGNCKFCPYKDEHNCIHKLQKETELYKKEHMK